MSCHNLSYVQALLTHKQELNTIRTFKFDKKWDFKKIFLPERFWHDCHLTLLCQEEGGAQCSRHMPLTDVNCNCIMHNYAHHLVHYAHYAHCTIEICKCIYALKSLLRTLHTYTDIDCNCILSTLHFEHCI